MPVRRRSAVSPQQSPGATKSGKKRGLNEKHSKLGTGEKAETSITLKDRPQQPLTIGRQGLATDRYLAVLAAALDPIITIDSKGFIQSASDSVQRVFGWSPAELQGRNVHILMPEPHRSAHDGFLSKYRRTGKTNILGRTREFVGVRKGGEQFPLELSVSRVDAPDGGLPLFVGMIRDITERRRLERELAAHSARLETLVEERTQELERSHEKLRMADRLASIGTLAAGLGHDMNNVLLPVRARLNALNAAAKTGKLAAPEHKQVDEIRKSIAYLQQLADGLHFLAMDPDSDEDAHGGAATDIQQWWSQAGALLSKAVPKHVRVSASLPADLPHVCVAAHSLTQAILNLVVNAGEAIPGPKQRKRRQGNVRIWAMATHDADGEWVRIGVTDNGTGMTEDVKRRAFEMFYTTKSRSMGTGLGLALVRKVVERAGGRIEVESELGKGTTVVMIVPATPSLGPATASDNAVSAVVSLQDGRAAAIIRHILETSGITVRTDNDHLRAQIWVLEPTSSELEAARAWRIRNPRGRLVLFGRPARRSAREWTPFQPVTIDVTDNFDSIRAVMNSVTAAR